MTSHSLNRMCERKMALRLAFNALIPDIKCFQNMRPNRATSVRSARPQEAVRRKVHVLAPVLISVRCPLPKCANEPNLAAIKVDRYDFCPPASPFPQRGSITSPPIRMEILCTPRARFFGNRCGKSCSDSCPGRLLWRTWRAGWTGA